MNNYDFVTGKEYNALLKRVVDLEKKLISAVDAKNKYTVAELKNLIREYNKTVEHKDRLKLGGKEDELINRLLDAGVKL